MVCMWFVCGNFDIFPKLLAMSDIFCCAASTNAQNAICLFQMPHYVRARAQAEGRFSATAGKLFGL